MAYEHIKFEVVDSTILVVTINRPERMNSITPAANAELRQAWEEFRDRPDLLVGVLTGEGSRAFCAGSDLSEAGAGTTKQPLPHGGITRDYVTWKPIIAAINGWAAGGGLEIALACDIRVAAKRARFVLTETAIGGTAGAGGTQRLPRTVPVGVALDMLLSGDPIDSEQALRYGLVSRVFDDDSLMDETLSLARRIASRAPLSIKFSKQAILEGVEMPLPYGLELESLLAQRLRDTEDVREGIRAFLEKRPPVFRGS